MVRAPTYIDRSRNSGSESGGGSRNARPPLGGLSAEELVAYLASLGERPYRAAQLRRHLYRETAHSFADMTDLPVGLRTRLAADFREHALEVTASTRSRDGSTSKILLRTDDGNLIESVSIREECRESSMALAEPANQPQPATSQRPTAPQRHTACISSQIGCAMACQFCASGLDGVVRNLTAVEIVEQFLHVRQLHGPVSNVVFMGMGEPMANFDEVAGAIVTLCGDEIGMGARRLTVSTVGVVPSIRRLIDLGLPVGLAVSLHAPNDALRAQLVPSTRSWSVAAILAAADAYATHSKRTVTYEYVLLAGVNDGEHEARQLGRLLRGRPAKVNLIPYNPVAELAARFRRPGRARVGRFRIALQRFGIPTTVRTAKGDEVAAACGQLRRQSPKTGARTALESGRCD